MNEETAVIEPPAATETTSTPESAEAAKTAVQRAFEVATESKQVLKPKAKPTVETKKPVEPTPPAQEANATPELEKQAELKLPSFITESKKTEEKPVEPEIKLEDLPVDPPATASENEKINWKKTRTLLEKQETELKDLRAKQSEKQEKGKELSQVDDARLKQLETELTQARTQLQRFGLEQHPQYVQQVLKPMNAAYVEAKRIIKDGGGDESALDKALTLTGKAHYDAMDEILGSIPESAKSELTSTVRDWRRLAQYHSESLANAPRALEQLQKQDIERQKQFVSTKRQEHEQLFEETVKNLRDKNKFELLIKTDQEDAKWWNEIPDKVISTARQLFLENQDMGTVAQACVLAASAGTMRDLWLKSEERASKAEKELAAIRGAEPRIGDSPTLPAATKDDIKEPFEKVFLRKLKSQAGT